jgi:16S rRNA processing protein RimM
MTWVLVGRLGRAHGIRGGIRIHTYHEQSDLLTEGMRLRVAVSKTVSKNLVIKKVYGQGDLLELEGIQDRNGAEELRGCEVEADRADFSALDDDEVYLVDFLGAQVRLPDGTPLGTIVAFGDNGAHPLADVKPENGDVVAMPFVPGIIVELDEEKKEVIVDPPEGLFFGDMAVAAKPNTKPNDPSKSGPSNEEPA